MPSFYPSTLPRQISLTPPDYRGQYTNSASGTMQSTNSSTFNQNGVYSRYPTEVHDVLDYTKPTVASSMTTHSRARYTLEHDRQAVSSYIAPLANTENAYGHAAAPMLPPVRIPDRSFNSEQAHFQNLLPSRPSVQAQPKEEKPVGGVAAHLDYEMEQMVDFVSEMAQGIVHPNALVPAPFRKYVSSILSATRLPSSTILLGLHYLATRMSMLSANGRYTAGNGQVYRMLTIALLLGSKFLDDNTFQNRSWSEVSGMPVSDLNELEIEWLLAIDWTMHINPDDTQGFMLWLDHWQRWQARKIETTLDSLKLTPLDANIRRQRSTHKQHQATSLYLPYSDSAFSLSARDRAKPQWQTSHRDQWPPSGTMTTHSPPSEPTTGPNTPEYYGRFGTPGFGSVYSMRTIPPPAQILPSQTQLGAYHVSYPPQQYTPTGWSTHGMGCGCSYCLPPHHERYLMAHGYGVQSVAG